MCNTHCVYEQIAQDLNRMRTSSSSQQPIAKINRIALELDDLN